ncbi:zinc finger and BTB domain-containing protein 46-like isoform X13 [Gigantopelta aegis]|uniref:zinc finger and BTB domain-containing protein 46-like isoform X13 n=1 Tax=Gigantopelta aegis TaxID=1735272 RepID=UPI001B88C088|nr:zinc finger and BTB domain-containing protein 46-like isoform X13 [Gigantopelta aegis]
MDKQYSVQFFTKFVEAMQKFCRDYIEFEQAVELSGYLSLEIDNYKKERYVLSEMVHSTGDVISESYCVKAFKTMKRLPSRSSEADLVLRDNTNMRRSGGYTDSQSLHQNIPSSGHSYRSRIHPAGTSHSSHLSSFSEQSSQRYVQSQSPMRQTQPPSFTQGSSGHGREPQDSLSSRGRPMQIQPRHSIQVPEGRGQKRSSTDGTGDGSSKKEKTDSDLESLYNAATNIASSSETTAATIGDIASTTASEPVSTSNESIRLPLTDMVTIKEENDVILLDDEGGGPSQLDVGSFANDSNSSSNLVDNSSLGAGDMFGSSVAGTGEGNPSGSSMSNEAMEETTIPKCTERTTTKAATSQFRCSYCSYKSNYSHGLKRHQRIHTGDFLRCHLCPSHFTEKYELTLHLKGHTGNLACKTCKKKYISKKGLNNHMKKYHRMDRDKNPQNCNTV